MPSTLTIRLSEKDRKTLEAAARTRGLGISALVRDIAEASAQEFRRAAIREEGERVVSYLRSHPEAQVELDDYGTPLGEIP